jgi:uncharacterized MnhB-related membrane protein
MSPWLDFALFSILAATAVGIVVLRHLFAVVMLGGVFSLVTSSLFVVMDAPDVAFTEAAVGAGVVTVLLLGAIALTTRREKAGHRRRRDPARRQHHHRAGADLWHPRSAAFRGARRAGPSPCGAGLPGGPGRPKSTSPTSSPRCWRATAASTPWARSSWSSPPASASCF